MDVEHGRFGYDAGHIVLLIAILAVLALGAIWLIASMRRNAMPATSAAPARAAASDGALAEARLRYARGQMSRDEYLQTAADLEGRTWVEPQPEPPSDEQP